MPLQENTYVRYWDGHAVAYGKIVKANEQTCSIEVGGTGRTVEIPNEHISIHPVWVAKGKLDKFGFSRKRIASTGYFYHATSLDLLDAIIKTGGLVPRSAVDWKGLGNDVWTGAEKAANRTPTAQVSISDYFKEVSHAYKGKDQDTKKYENTLLGDVGEFFYAAPRHDDVLLNYITDIHSKGKKKPIVFRFKDPQGFWYPDPKSTAVMKMGGVSLDQLEITLIGKKLLNKWDANMVLGEEALIQHLEDSMSWAPCSRTDMGWKEVFDLEVQFENLSL